MPPSRNTRKLAPGTLAAHVKLSLTDYDVTKLDACLAMVEERLGRPVTQSKLYSVALSILHQRLLDSRDWRESLYLMFRY